MKLFRYLSLIIFLIFSGPILAQDSALIRQDFETDFTIQSDPLEFLPGWRGNDVRTGSSRIFQANGVGLGGSRALAVQPISTFSGVIQVKLDPRNFEDARVRFFARSGRNGTGNRPAEVRYAWGQEGVFASEQTLGDFANEDQDYRLFELEIPENLQGAEITLRLTVRQGSGAGTSARWFLDDFAYGTFIQDVTAPSLVNLRGFGSRTLELLFSEAIDPVFSQLPLAYLMDGENPEVSRLQADSLVYLDFGTELVDSRSYELQIRQIPDLSGNFLQDTVLNFTFFDPTAVPRKGLVINELMPAPKADLDLPNVEYLELFHTGDRAFRLDSLIFATDSRSAVLPEIWLDPGEYVLLVPAAQASEFSRFGRVVPVANWPTLLNSGTRLRLLYRGFEIDALSYASASWGSAELAAGGYSLELPNPFLTCEQSANLRPSVAPLRGTPGQENSVLDLRPDEDSPTLLQAFFSDSSILKFSFDEQIFPDLAPESLRLGSFAEVDSAWVVGKEVLFRFAFPLQENQVVQVLKLEVFDCSGNPFSGPFPLSVVLPRPAKAEDVQLNELLFNPITGDPKFVELANRSEDYLDLKGWQLANRNELGEADDIEQVGSLILPPGAFVAITTDTLKLKARYPRSANGFFFQLRSLPSYPISGGTVILLDTEGQEVEFFDYDEDLHHPLLRDPKGVSLERISAAQSSSQSQNWQSASASQDFATPGRKNSQSFEQNPGVEMIQIDPEVFDPEGANGQTFTRISYQLNSGAWVGSFRIYDLGGRLIQSLAENSVLGSSGGFIWTGTDQSGKRVKMGYYVLLVELFDPNGQTQSVKKTIVVGSRL
ncbi:lamin tail domain-containing protein [Algoriphagus namhaensis]